eukprot:5183007-Lingulodinium_polyedra.AAC.1
METRDRAIARRARGHIAPESPKPTAIDAHADATRVAHGRIKLPQGLRCCGRPIRLRGSQQQRHCGSGP